MLPVLVSALTGEGVERLLAAIETRLGEARQTLQLSIDPVRRRRSELALSPFGSACASDAR